MRSLYCAIFLPFMLLASAHAQSPNSISGLIQRAKSGEAEAQFELARAYQNGAGISQSDAQAAYWFSKAAEQDYAEAENSLGVVYALGRGVTRDHEKAMQWYRKAANHGLVRAYYNIGISYYNGDGVDRDLERSYAFLLLAQSKGDAQAAEALHHLHEDLQGDVGPAKLQLAEMLESGDEVPQDIQGAIKGYMELAGSGPKDTFSYAQPYRQAQFHLCQLYLEGKGAPKDYAQARERCKKAAKYGLYSADFVLGRMAAEGVGQEKNLKKAAEYYQDAAVGLFPDAFLQLANLKLESGAHQDAKEAYFWLYVAQTEKIPRADAILPKAAGSLNEKEIASIQKQAQQWLMLGPVKLKPRIK